MSFAESLGHHALLVGSVSLVAWAGWRLAAAAGARGLERVLGATVAGAAFAVAEALALGLAGLGGNALALFLGVVLAAAAAWRFLPAAPADIPWHRLSLGERVALGAAAGAWLAWALWLLRYPALGHDMLLYHVPEAIRWVHDGTPGSVERVVENLPVGNYPLTHEVLLAWGMGLGRSFVWVWLVTAAAPLLIAAGAWAALRRLAVPRVASALGALALVATPAVIASQSGGASLDPAALGWLIACGVLCLAAREEPRLFALALVAAGLAVGTKTTAAPLALVLLVLGFVLVRPRVGVALAAALVATVAVGGTWYLRNLLSHGSPLWPFVDAPWGDDSPPVIADAAVSFLDRPGDTLDQLGDYYVDRFGGPLLLLLAALLAPLFVRRREVMAASAAVVVSVLIWMNAPFTGVVESSAFAFGTGDATRYLLPGVAAAVLAVALVARAGGRLAIAASAVLGVAALVGVENTFDIGFPSAPSVATPLAGALAGAVAAAAVRRVPAARSLAVLALVAAVPLAALAADGYAGRHADTDTLQAEAVGWLDGQDAWHDDEREAASTFSLIAPLAGDHLQHELELMRADEPCPRVAQRRADGWVVLDRPSENAYVASRCLLRERPDHLDGHYRAFEPK